MSSNHPKQRTKMLEEFWEKNSNKRITFFTGNTFVRGYF